MKRMFPMILLFALLLCVPVRADELTLDAPSALLMEKQTGTVLFAKDEHTPREPASVTKVMTLLLTMEAIDSGALSYDDTVTGSAHAASMGGSQIWLKEGEQMRVEDLIKAVCIVSGNDAAVALGEHLAGSEEAFVARMNERATELVCEHTHFANATGLHNSQHYTTAWDLYLITREAMKHDKFMEICNSKSYTVPATNMTDKPRELHSTNFLISNWRARGYVYRDAQGIKTGSTPEAGYCLISSALRGSRHMISVVLGAERVTLEDGVTIQTRSFSETSRMFDWGFDNFVLLSLIHI